MYEERRCSPVVGLKKLTDRIGPLYHQTSWRMNRICNMKRGKKIRKGKYDERSKST